MCRCMMYMFPHSNSPGGQASATVINAFSKLDVASIWGDSKTAAADDSQIDTWESNLLAETSIGYGTGVRTSSRGLTLAALPHLSRSVATSSLDYNPTGFCRCYQDSWIDSCNLPFRE